MILVVENDERQKNVHSVMEVVKSANKYEQYLVSSSRLAHAGNVMGLAR